MLSSSFEVECLTGAVGAQGIGGKYEGKAGPALTLSIVIWPVQAQPGKGSGARDVCQGQRDAQG